ncbi:hypothetical protein MTR_3g073340 [Medicago truncatula]|uniref:Uncharacterized protein n=1 Tax=Medicago truncatula TaxID=3880 RepID=G7J3P6_MEDTR|nr:hypothetical protein MTR_3g073340 [Medicago truncatula]
MECLVTLIVRRPVNRLSGQARLLNRSGQIQSITLTSSILQIQRNDYFRDLNTIIFIRIHDYSKDLNTVIFVGLHALSFYDMDVEKAFKRNFVDLAYNFMAYLEDKEHSNFQLKGYQSRRGGEFH